MTADPFESEYVWRPESLGYVKVLEVLREWDPIGVFEINPNWPSDEYDSYAAPLVRLLDAGAPRDEIVHHLGSIATEYMGLGDYDLPRTIACVIELIQFWQSWKSWRAAAKTQDTTLREVAWHVLDATADD